jgi:hypothetical protein
LPKPIENFRAMFSQPTCCSKKTLPKDFLKLMNSHRRGELHNLMYPHVHTFHLHGMKSLQLFSRIGYPGAGYICNDFPVKEKSIAEEVQILLDIVLHFLHTHL